LKCGFDETASRKLRGAPSELQNSAIGLYKVLLHLPVSVSFMALQKKSKRKKKKKQLILF